MELGQGTKKDEGGRRRRTSSGDDGGGGGSDDQGGTRQPYNCTFCKRGFPTAQALGGHMNAHRKKDRGRAPSTPTTVAAAAAARSTPTTLVDAFTGHGAQDRPASGAGGSSLRRADERAPQELRLFGHVDGGAGRGEEGNARDRREYRDANDGNGDDHGEQGDEEGLDLELRLGAAGQ